jgi:hypothetical protein
MRHRKGINSVQDGTKVSVLKLDFGYWKVSGAGNLRAVFIIEKIVSAEAERANL